MATRKTTKARAKKGGAQRSARKAPARPAARRAGKPAGMRSVTPSLTVNDLGRSIAWYRDVLGFAITDRWEHDGALVGVEMKAGAVSVFLGQDDWKKGRDRVKGEGFRIFVETGQDVDRLAERIRAAGAALAQEPRDESWGGRTLAVADPDGFKLTISKMKGR